MTAEIAILNKEAVALAADSAVTFSSEQGQKIFTSANKIFALTKHHPIGIMVFGNAVFHGTPWETIVKEYRKALGKQGFATTEEHATHFLRYLEKTRAFSSIRMQEQLAEQLIHSYFAYIRRNILDQVKLLTDPAKGAGLTKSQIPALISTAIGRHLEVWEKAKPGPFVTPKLGSTILKVYRKTISEGITNEFENLPLTALHKRKLTEIAAMVLMRRANGLTPPARSGVVIAGFGANDIFPKCLSYTVMGVVANRLIYFEDTNQCISEAQNDSVIVPFAQDDVARSFIEGVDPNYDRSIRSEMASILKGYPTLILNTLGSLAPAKKAPLETKLKELGEAKVAEYRDRLQKFRQEKYISPILNVVAMLPKDELATMAETLVNLTSFKRRMSMTAETVGGPADVAVISKGDGFIWIKRKHYFSKDLNPSFGATI